VGEKWVKNAILGLSGSFLDGFELHFDAIEIAVGRISAFHC
jgi:hypothetical protein